MDDTVKVVGLDIAKNVFVAVGLDGKGKIVFRKKLSRAQVLPQFAKWKAVEIGIEACAGSHDWARQLIEQGHDVKLIAAQHVKAYVTRNKNDTNDAAAIAEARSRAATKYVPINTCAQQDLQMLHRVREALKQERTALICRMRAFAMEYGQVFPVGVAPFLKAFVAWIHKEDNGLSGCAQESFVELKEQLDHTSARLAKYDERIAQAAKESHAAQKLLAIPGVGPLTATAVVAALADPRHFASARDFAANLGLTPKEHSSGGKIRLGAITRRGNTYLRTLLIHGARSALLWARDKPDAMLQWAKQLAARRGNKIAAVALANKLARVIWAVLAHDRCYTPRQIDSLTQLSSTTQA